MSKKSQFNEPTEKTTLGLPISIKARLKLQAGVKEGQKDNPTMAAIIVEALAQYWGIDKTDVFRYMTLEEKLAEYGAEVLKVYKIINGRNVGLKNAIRGALNGVKEKDIEN